ncbi:MAG TPA: EF-hand domain-containing protein [Pirellulaceae bacterium]|nr:EF-hand domain-containing protein [Pirellulaceae bacterium]
MYRSYWTSLLAVVCLIAISASQAAAQRPGRGGEGGQDRGQTQDRGGPPGQWGQGGRGEGGRGEGGRGDFDPASFLRRLDANGNGVLEQSEMSDRTRGMLERIGLDPSKDHPLEKISEQFQAQREGGQPPAATQPVARQIERKVPGFGVDAPAPKLPSGFGADITLVGGAPASMSQYSQAIQEMVQQALARYDANGNGIIDGDEMSRVRWSSPSAVEADLNGDGALTVNEIAERFLARERMANTGGQDGGSRGNDRNNDQARRDDNNRDNNRRPEPSGRGSESSEPARGPNENTASSSERRGSDDVNRYRSYVEGMMKRYDKNGNGVLDREELQQMTRPPTDLNGDGIVTLDEYIEFVRTGDSPSSSASDSGDTRPTTARGENSSSEDRSTGRGSMGRNRSSSSSPPGGGTESPRGSSQTQFSFFERDANGDGQIQMHEFAQQWNDEVLSQFRFYDLNGDGVITYAEYEAAKKSR